MAHIVFVTGNLPSLLNSSLEMARRLRVDGGHRVTFVCLAADERRIADQGESVVALTGEVRHDRVVERLGPAPISNPIRLVGWLRRRRAIRRDSIEDRELGESVARLAPDLVVIDIEYHAAVIATADLDVPRVVATNMFSVFAGPDLPPLHLDIGVPEGRRDRLALAARWRIVRLRSVLTRVRHRLTTAGLAAPFTPVRPATVDPLDLRALARSHGLDLRAVTDRSQWLRPFVVRDLPVLCYNAWEMELPHRPDPRLRYLGPMIRSGRVEPALPPAAADRWRAVLAARAGPDRRPLVYCSLGTVWSVDGSLLARVIDVFRARPDWDLVVGLGHRPERVPGPPPPDNVLLLEWAPQLEILANADVAVTHGGVNSLSEAVRHGVPLVVYSSGFVDHHGNARRVAHHRLGVVGDAARDGAADIEAAIDQARTDPEIRAGVDRMRAAFMELERHDPGRRLVDEIVARSPSSGPT